MRCMNRCPKRAIETAHGYVAAFLLLFYGAMSALVYPALRPVVPAISDHGVVPALVRFIFQSVMMMAALFASYRLLHRALRFRTIERLVVLTSFTHFGCWRRYRPPGTTVER